MPARIDVIFTGRYPIKRIIGEQVQPFLKPGRIEQPGLSIEKVFHIGSLNGHAHSAASAGDVTLVIIRFQF